MMNAEKAKEIITGFKEIVALAIPIANRLAKIKEYEHTFTEDDFSLHDDHIIAEWEVYLGYGEYNSYSIEINIDDIFDETFISNAEEEKRIKDDIANKAYAKRRKQQKQENEAKEKAYYLKLKQKWE